MVRYKAEGPWTCNYHLRRMKMVVQIVKSTLLEGNSFSDIGCGTGEYMEIAGKNATLSVGIDISSSYLRRAQVFIGEHSHLVLAALGSGYLPFKDQCFDVVLCSEVLEHLQNMDKAINELFRISKSIIIITLPVRGTLRESLGSLPAIEKRIDLIDKKVGHINIISLNKICSKLVRKRWSITPTTSWNYCEPMETIKLPMSFSPFIMTAQRILDSLLPNSGNAAIIICRRDKNA